MILAHEVGVHTYSPGTPTGYGYPEPAWTPPLADPGTRLKVYGWAPRGTSESGVNPGNLVQYDVDLLAPVGTKLGPDDVVDLPIGQFHVVGYPLDSSSGPFSSQLGMVIKLRLANAWPDDAPEE